MRRTAAALLVAACVAACGEPTREVTIPDSTLPPIEPAPVAFPSEEWERADRGDWAALDQELAATGSTCVAVVHEGALVHDAYFNGGSAAAPVRTYSITKSLSALLTGALVGDGDLALDDPAAEAIGAWGSGATGDITVEDLLSMTSGRAWSEATDRAMIRQAADQSDYAVGLDQADAPGEWQYDNAAVQTLEPVLAAAAGRSVVELAEDRLLGPLGMADTRWPTDGAGNATTYSGVESTCLDLARVGYLVLNDGRWGDEQLVPADFVEQMTQPSSDRNAAYGWLWWTNAEGRVVEVHRQAGFATDKAPYEGRLAPNVPADATWAFGYGNQYVAVVPSEDLVAVRLGRRPASPDQVTFDSFTSAVIEALD